MKLLYISILLGLIIACQHQKESPNIIYILADDLGYAELGTYGQQKIETPNIDALAKQGMLFTQHYSAAPVCAPARYMLMTGKHSGHAFIRGNDEWVERGDVWDYRKMVKDSTLEGQRPIPNNTVLLSQKLQEIGYKTGIVGKWGLGAPHTDAIPNKKGFDFFFGYNCQRQAHTYYPVHLYKNENRVYLKNDTIAPHTKLKEGTDFTDPKSYAMYNLDEYTPDLIFKEMMGFINENKAHPFFMYWATPIPHNPIQAPKRWVDYYENKFGEEEPYKGEKGYFPHYSPRAAYAGMISYLDENIGKLITYLKKENLYDNTLIVFTSDNGVTYSGGTDGKFFNSSGVFGEKYGRGKGFVYEGGIHVPMIAVWPEHIASNSTSDLISAQYDVMDTFSDLLGFSMPKEATDGISFLPTLLGKKQSEKHDFLFWEFPEYGGQVAIRMGDWKLIRQHLKDNISPTLELYNLKNDPSEQNNIVEKHPEIVQKAVEIFNKEHQTPQLELFRIPSIEDGLIQN